MPARVLPARAYASTRLPLQDFSVREAALSRALRSSALRVDELLSEAGSSAEEKAALKQQLHASIQKVRRPHVQPTRCAFTGCC